MLKLAFQYMRHYKSQTFAIWVGMFLTASLTAGVSSLLYSSQRNDLENAKTIYGDWHYAMQADTQLLQPVHDGDSGPGFLVEQCGKIELKDIVTYPYQISMIYADSGYYEMTHRDLLEGAYPKSANEAAADRYTLGNLGFKGGIGDVLTIGGKEFILSGILKSPWASDADEMELFVSEPYADSIELPVLYLRFDEGRKLYRQLDAFCTYYQIPGDAALDNDALAGYLNLEQPERIYDIIKFALTDEKGNFTYILLKLQSGYHLAQNGMAAVLCLFSLFIVYSIFQISVSKRMAEYGIMQTLGISAKRIGCTLVLELWILFLTAYAPGCLLGLGMADRAGTGVFLAALNVIVGSFVFLFAAFAVTGFWIVHTMQKQTLRQSMAGDVSFVKRRRKIYSLRNVRLVNVLIHKFMFSNKKKVIGMLLSLSVGGCLFLCTTYMAENLKIHADMSLRSDDGLGSQYKVSVKSNSLSDTIPERTVDTVRQMSELSDVYASKYTLGELVIKKQELEWDEYFDEQNKDSYFQQQYGGICVEKKDGTYGIKYDVYGYDEAVINQLQDFVLEGEIDFDVLESENQVLAAANQDGQGNYDFYGKHPGDTITLRVPKDLHCPPEVLKFQSLDENYITKEFQIAAIVSRALAKEHGYLNREQWNNAQSVIMTNGQMGSLYGIMDYSFLNASAADGAGTDKAAGLLLQTIQDVPKAVLQDYTTAIEAQKQYLQKQQMFFYGIAVILLVVSLFHIMNSMHYSVLSHRREYGIIRAMGITDSGFYRMVLKTGLLYGLLADVLIFLTYHLVLRRGMDYYMMHIVQFLHITAGVPNVVMALIMILNLVIAAAAAAIPAGKIVKSDIIREIESS